MEPPALRVLGTNRAEQRARPEDNGGRTPPHGLASHFRVKAWDGEKPNGLGCLPFCF